MLKVNEKKKKKETKKDKV